MSSLESSDADDLSADVNGSDDDIVDDDDDDDDDDDEDDDICGTV